MEEDDVLRWRYDQQDAAHREGMKKPAADPTRLDPVGRTKAERDFLAQIDKDLAWLTAAIEDPDTRPGPLSHYRARRAALRWMLSRVADAEQMEKNTA